MKFAVVLALLLLQITGGELAALTLKNQDTTLTTVTIIADDEEQSYEIAPGETISDICMKGCIAIFGDGEEIEMKGTEAVSIEDSIPNIEKQAR